MAESNPDSRWAQWHRAYGDPQSALTNRLETVRSRIRQALEARRDGPIRLISVCSGQGNDVVGALKEHPRAAAVTGRLFEWDSYNCEAARVALNDAGLKGVEVVQADASYTTVYEDSVPADLVLLCGIFGNVSDEDVHNTVRNTSRLCAEGAWVIWTRHRRAPDLTPRIRHWFRASGFEEIGFESPADESFAVGTHEITSRPLPFKRDIQLFTFVT